MSGAVFTPDHLAAMRARLAELTEEFLRESDPQALAGLHRAELRTLLAARKQRTGYLLAAISDLQRILERVPASSSASAGDAAADTVAEAKRLGAQLRERAKAMQ